MTKHSILLLFGGESFEHEVSIKSAKNVLAAIDGNKFLTSLCYIDRAGNWQLVENITDNASGVTIMPKLGEKCFVTADNEEILIDVILPILHGSNGEDGTVQGLAQLLHIPIVGPDILSAAITMEKEVTKNLLKGAGMNVAKWIAYKNGQQLPQYDMVQKMLGSPLFIKPSAQGSSVGVSEVTNENEFNTALEHASTFDDTVLIEEAIKGREIEVAVIGNETPQATKAGEIIVETFYSYEEKYSTDSQAKIIVPADLSDELHEIFSAKALEVYRILHCRGMARVDFFLTSSNEIYINEVNSLPGFTNISMYPKLWQQVGLSYPELIENLISYALSDTITIELEKNV